MTVVSQGELFTKVEPVDPSERWTVPASGNTPAAAHASYTGARTQTAEVWTAKQAEFLQVLQAGGKMSRNELAAVLRWPLASVCSILDSVRDRIESAGEWETVAWSEGRTSKRERFRIRSK